MPTTVNGIGTRYCGKKNPSTRHDTCSNCGREVELRSYDTTLFFVFLFIPLIPLGKKRVIDECPRCTSHHAMPLGDYQNISEETITELIVSINAALMSFILLLMKLAPLGIFCLVAARFAKAQLDGQFLTLLKTQAWYMTSVLTGLAIHAGVTLPALLWIFSSSIMRYL